MKGAILILIYLKELRPEDSVPFLRRVSTDLQARQLSIQNLAEGYQALETSQQTVSPIPAEEPEFVIKPHSFVKTTFSKRKSRALPSRILVLLTFAFHRCYVQGLPAVCQEKRSALRGVQLDLSLELCQGRPRSLRCTSSASSLRSVLEPRCHDERFASYLSSRRPAVTFYPLPSLSGYRRRPAIVLIAIVPQQNIPLET